MAAAVKNAPPPKVKPFDTVGFIIAFENGETDETDMVDGFQVLIDSGTINHLQGTYQRIAADLIQQGLCTGTMERLW